MQIEFANNYTIACQIALKLPNILESLFPDILGDKFRRELLLLQQLRMHPHNQGFFVVAAIEQPDHAALRQTSRAAPQVIVIELLAAWRFEGLNLTALRIDAGHDMLNDAVLACRIHRLKDNQHR